METKAKNESENEYGRSEYRSHESRPFVPCVIKITSAAEAEESIRFFISKNNLSKQMMNQEFFMVSFLKNNNSVIETVVISIGTVNECSVDVPSIFRGALNSDGCKSFICYHNHPSGDTTPSPADLSLTRRIESAGQLMGIRMLDHIIIGEHSGEYASLHGMGIIGK